MYALGDSQVPILNDGNNDIFIGSDFKMIMCIIITIVLLYILFILKVDYGTVMPADVWHF